MLVCRQTKEVQLVPHVLAQDAMSVLIRRLLAGECECLVKLK